LLFEQRGPANRILQGRGSADQVGAVGVVVLARLLRLRSQKSGRVRALGCGERLEDLDEPRRSRVVLLHVEPSEAREWMEDGGEEGAALLGGGLELFAERDGERCLGQRAVPTVMRGQGHAA